MKLLIAIVHKQISAQLVYQQQVDFYAQETLLSSSGLKKNVYKKR